MVGVPALRPETFPRSFPKTHRAQTRNTEAIKHTDPAGLHKALSKLSLQAELAGTDGHTWMPLAPDAQEWFERCMDAEHVLRSSTAVIVDGVLRVVEGPLVGQEAGISKVDRHRRRCEVALGWDGSFTEQMPLDVPFKS